MESVEDLKDELNQYEAALTVMNKVEEKLNQKSNEETVSTFDMIDAMGVKYSQIVEKVMPLWKGEGGDEFIESMETTIDKIGKMNLNINEVYLGFIKEKAEVKLKVEELQNEITRIGRSN